MAAFWHITTALGIKKYLFLNERCKRNVNEKEATVREEEAPLGQRSCSPVGPLLGDKTGCVNLCLSLVTIFEPVDPDCLIIYFAHLKRESITS